MLGANAPTRHVPQTPTLIPSNLPEAATTSPAPEGDEC